MEEEEEEEEEDGLERVKCGHTGRIYNIASGLDHHPVVPLPNFGATRFPWAMPHPAERRRSLPSIIIPLLITAHQQDQLTSYKIDIL